MFCTFVLQLKDTIKPRENLGFYAIYY